MTILGPPLSAKQQMALRHAARGYLGERVVYWVSPDLHGMIYAALRRRGLVQFVSAPPRHYLTDYGVAIREGLLRRQRGH